MNGNFFLLKPLRILLFPFSLLFGLAIWVRNLCFDKHLLASLSFNLPVVCIGNLAVGGTGKSPMVEFLLKNLRGKFQLAVLSRGYKRKTRGYALASDDSTALDIGDEPMQFHSKFPEVTIAVAEERVVAIPLLLHDRPHTDAIILDDAFQHRWVKAGLNILLTDYSNLYTRDWFLPTGDLRDEKRSYRRADLLVVSKCPKDLPPTERASIERELNPRPGQEVFYSTIQYGAMYHLFRRDHLRIGHGREVLLVAGIANPVPLKKWLEGHCRAYFEMAYGDHHIYSIDDLRDIVSRFEAIEARDKIVLTTEKDAMRLLKFEQVLRDLPIYVLPIESVFLFDGDQRFTDIITNFIREFRTPSPQA